MFYRLYFYISLSIFIIFLAFFFQTGFWEKNKRNFFERVNLNGIDNYKFYPKILLHKVNSIFDSQNEIKVFVNQANINKIENNREEILEFLKNTKIKNDSTKFKHLFPFVEANAKIQLKNNTIKSNIRLKGDRMIHFEDQNNSSYRLKIRDNETYNGMTKFSLQKPRIRNYLHEWIFHELLGVGGLVRINYEFYDFYLNNDYKGYYVLEESFDNNLLIRNNRPVGPIFSTFEEFNRTNLNSKKMFEVYDKKSWTNNESKLLITKETLEKIDSYLKGNLNFNDVFDIKKWAWFFAVTDLTYTYHGTMLKSVKFYYNPSTSKIEPIGYDGHRTLPNFSKYNEVSKFNKTNFTLAKENLEKKLYDRIFPIIQTGFFFNNEDLNYDFYEEYIKAIYNISSEEFLNKFFEDRKKKIKNINSGIYSDDYEFDKNSLIKSGIGIYYYDKEDIYRRADNLRKMVYPNIDEIFIYIENNQLNIKNNNYNNFFLKDGKIICEKYDIPIADLKIYKKELVVQLNDKFDNSCKKIVFNNSINNKNYSINVNKYN